MTSDKKPGADQYSARAAHRGPTLIQRLRSSLLTGIIVVAPFTITLYLAWYLIVLVDELVLPLIPRQYWPENPLPFYVPGVGLVVFIVFMMIVGSLARNFFGRQLIRLGESWVDRMPVVRSIYNALKQIAETIFAESSNSFEQACLIEYPRKGLWAIAFVSTKARGEIRDRASDGKEMLSVFMPTTPNPTSGFLLFVPAEDVVILDMTVEEAAKLVISAGLIVPPTEAERAQANGAAPKTVEAHAAADLAKTAARVEARRPYSLRNRRQPPNGG